MDKAADNYDQVIENEQREGLKPLELALFVKGELEKGVSQAEVARRLGKSQTYMTFVRAMIDPPAWLMDVYRSGRCRNASHLYELRRLDEADPQRVEQTLGGTGRIGSGDVDRLKKGGEEDEGPSTKGHSRRENAGVESTSLGQPVSPERPAIAQQDAQETLVLTASYQGTRVRVQVGALPSRKSTAFINDLVTGERLEAEIGALSKLELVRALSERRARQMGTSRFAAAEERSRSTLTRRSPPEPRRLKPDAPSNQCSSQCSPVPGSNVALDHCRIEDGGNDP